MSTELSFLVLGIVLVIVFYVAAGLRIVHEHEQAVVMRFGKFMSVLGPGLQLIVPFVDRVRKVDLRTLVVTERIEPGSERGRVQIWGESWQAQSADGQPIGTGTHVEVVSVDGRFVIVRDSRDGESAPGR